VVGGIAWLFALKGLNGLSWIGLDLQLLLPLYG